MIGIDWLAVAALVISALVAMSQVVKEMRESRKAKLEGDQLERDYSQIPIRGASDAVLALQHALEIANSNEDRLRARIVFLEKENDLKDEKLMQLERRMWTLERQLDQLRGNTGNG